MIPTSSSEWSIPLASAAVLGLARAAGRSQSCSSEEVDEKSTMCLSSQYSHSTFNVWFKDDIQHALRAVDTANAALLEVINTPEMRLYRQGYEAALRAVAEAFGVSPELGTQHKPGDAAPMDITPY